jgi:proton-translocating NADH-quinone oxidoreductase chain L
MYSLIIFLPLIGSISAGLGGRFLGPRGAGLITTSCMVLTLILSCIAFYEVGLSGSICTFKLIPWINSELFTVWWGFLFDSLTVVMLVVVSFVSTLVHLYSTEYMSHDPHLPRFMSYLSLFSFFMLILVTADNLVQMFVGWEGVGLCSYLLINFWYTRIQANKAAIKAMLMNRIGDFALALGIFSCFFAFNTVDYHTLFSIVPLFKDYSINFFALNFSLLEFICILFFLGAVGKSAQLGLHTWLPDAMEGPTPVSALIHAATMVTAGVFLIARCSPIFEQAPICLFIITIVGAMTAFFAATTGLLQNDLKKVIAYSTCSQLGYMIFACGISNYSVGVFHLANHAFFKALLFLGAGSIIHAVGDEQDMRKMGGLQRLLPFTYAMMFIGSLALMGFPFLTGFYSKDAILELAYAKFSNAGHFAYYLGSMAAFFTAFYSIRLIYLTFLTNPNGSRVILTKAHESAWPMSLALALLAIPSIFIGYTSKDLFIGMGTDFWGLSIFTSPENFQLVEAEFLDLETKLFPLFLSFFGAGLAYFLYTFSAKTLYLWKLTDLGRSLYNFFNRKWYFDRMYIEHIGQNVLQTAYTFTYRAIDRGLIEMFGPFGLAQSTNLTSSTFGQLQSGYLYHYALFILVGITSFLFFLIYCPQGFFFLIIVFPLIASLFLLDSKSVDN